MSKTTKKENKPKKAKKSNLSRVVSDVMQAIVSFPLALILSAILSKTLCDFEPDEMD